MRRPWLPVAIYLLLLAAALGHFLLFAPELPAKIATHFNLAGKADGWMRADTFRWSYLAFLVLFPLLMPACMFVVRFLAALMNVPNKNDWTAAGQWERASRFLFHSSFWLAALEVIFCLGMYILVLEANRAKPPVLNNAWMTGLTILQLTGVFAWALAIILFFVRGPGSSSTGSVSDTPAPRSAAEPFTKVYPSAVDWWFAAILILTPLGILVAGFVFVAQNPLLGIISLLTGFFVGGLIALLSLPCRYILTESALTIQCGVVKETIPLRRLRGVRLSSSILSAPALSLKRIEITLDQGFLLISPRDRKGFLLDLDRAVGGSRDPLP